MMGNDNFDLKKCVQTKKRFLNRVPPCPWKSTAPVGCNVPVMHFASHIRKNILQTHSAEMQKHRSTQNPKIIPQTHLFRQLNRQTLILTFPEASAIEIDEALSTCNNNLSAAIKILQVKGAIRKKRIKHKDLNMLQMESKDSVTYIPTQYEDVQIVEPSGSANVLKIPTPISLPFHSNNSVILQSPPSPNHHLPLQMLHGSRQENSMGVPSLVPFEQAQIQVTDKDRNIETSFVIVYCVLLLRKIPQKGDRVAELSDVWVS
ncbi:hypothetical protein FQA39_LY00815 [Lamprigera yunnana]|nr:hypothetical protein FQA39_LY00815 [Lamprigera yunnana]